MDNKNEYDYNGRKVSKATYYRLKRKDETVSKSLKTDETVVKKEPKVQKEKSNKSNLNDILTTEFARAIINDIKDDYVIMHRLGQYKNAFNNSTYRLTKRCLKFVRYDKEIIRVVLKNK